MISKLSLVVPYKINSVSKPSLVLVNRKYTLNVLHNESCIFNFSSWAQRCAGFSPAVTSHKGITAVRVRGAVKKKCNCTHDKVDVFSVESVRRLPADVTTVRLLWVSLTPPPAPFPTGGPEQAGRKKKPRSIPSIPCSWSNTNSSSFLCCSGLWDFLSCIHQRISQTIYRHELILI